MTKKFACGDVVNGCGWSATANDEAELFKKISEHAKHDSWNVRNSRRNNKQSPLKDQDSLKPFLEIFC
jgi:predicted small metal-binding protein